MTGKEAKKVVRWFQANIGLDDWTIDIAIGEPQYELGEDIYPSDRGLWMGRCCHKVSFREATIWVNPSGHTEPRYGTETSTLIHELLHCFFASCGMDSDKPFAEYAVNRLADLLGKNYAT